VGNLIFILLEIYCALQQRKNFANRSRIDKVMAMVRVAPFFDSQCRAWHVGNRQQDPRSCLVHDCFDSERWFSCNQVIFFPVFLVKSM